MSTTATAEQKKTSLENRIHSHYKSCLKSNRHNRQSARDSTVKMFGVSYADLTRIIDTKEAEALGVDAKSHRITKQLERSRKATNYGKLRGELLKAGKLRDSDSPATASATINSLLLSERLGY